MAIGIKIFIMKKLSITGLAIILLAMVGCKKELTTEAVGLTTLEQANTTPTLSSV